MSTDNDVARSLRSWLMENRHEDADRVLDAVFAEIPATPQRQAGWLTRRFSAMNSSFVRVALAAAALVVIAVVGYQFLGVSNTGGPNATETPRQTDTPEPSGAAPSPSPVAGLFPLVECAELEAGTYRAAIGSFSVTVSVPAGWKGSSDRDHFNVNSRGSCLFAGGVTLYVSLVSHVYSNACDGQGTAVETGTPAAVTAALAAQTGHQTSGPRDTTIAGYPASRFEFSVPGDTTPCNLGPLWLAPGDGEGPTMYEFDGSGSFVTVYVVDVDGSALGIAIDSGVPDEPADVAELDAIVASLQIEP